MLHALVCLTLAAFPLEAELGIESKLIGTWVGGPCVGSLQIMRDGRFERRGYSPGNNRLAGTWKVKWDALPPTLVLDCTESDADHWIGTKYETKLLELTADRLGLLHLSEKTTWPEELDHSKGETLVRYERRKAD
jgi:hypothetical protein